MITYLVTAAHAYTMEEFLSTWGKNLTADIRVCFYEDLAGATELPKGACIFSDLERLSGEQRRSASQLASTLSGSGLPVLNHPNTALCRYELLRALQERGINRFRVYPIGDVPERFPVFVRAANDHKGSLTKLLHSEARLTDAIGQLEAAGRHRQDLMIVEYLETADTEGLYRKYSCFIIGDCFIPRHLLFSRNWITKKPDVVNSALAQEESLFLQRRPHPHEERIRHIFRIAGITFGRIDYALVDGEIQVWEINTNPVVTVAGPKLAPERYRSQARVYKELCRAFKSLADLGAPTQVAARGETLWHQIGRRLARAIST